MTESYILMVLGIGIGCSITVWLWAKSIDKQVRGSGAEVVMFVNSAKKLIVLDAKTRVPVKATESLTHEDHHHAEIRLNQLGEPVLWDMSTSQPQPMVQHKIDCNGRRVSTPISPHIIYFSRYKGSNCVCIGTGANHFVRCR
jgi:hypothetical protein